MTQDEIIEMARQAGGVADDKTIVMWHSELEAFAKLVAAKEREACALESENCGAIHVAKRIRARGEA